MDPQRSSGRQCGAIFSAYDGSGTLRKMKFRGDGRKSGGPRDRGSSPRRAIRSFMRVKVGVCVGGKQKTKIKRTKKTSIFFLIPTSRTTRANGATATKTRYTNEGETFQQTRPFIFESFIHSRDLLFGKLISHFIWILKFFFVCPFFGFPHERLNSASPPFSFQTKIFPPNLRTHLFKSI